MAEAASSTHQVDWMHQISMHPAYVEEFVKTEHFLMTGFGPLTYDVRHYIALMAAQRHQCQPLIKYHTKQFLACGGDFTWTNGLDCAPNKLQKLNVVNKIMAHTPWLLKRSHLHKLTRGWSTGGDDCDRRIGDQNWAVGELSQALVLLAHFHALCSFIWGSQILEFSDEEERNMNNEIPPLDHHHRISIDVIEHLMEKQNLCHKKDFRYDLPEFDEYSNPLFKRTTPAVENLDRRIVSVHEWSWEAHTYETMSFYYREVEGRLDNKFQVAYHLTYFTMGHKKDVDTSVFREAVWNCIYKFYGILRDDFDYHEMEELLGAEFIAYAQKFCFHPERLVKDDLDQIMKAFRPTERVHVNILLFEARFQSIVMHASNALNYFMGR